jgi:hypothetical protein
LEFAIYITLVLGLVWHADYVDHVDEKTLAGSFEAFLERINFSILGVTGTGSVEWDIIRLLQLGS